MKSIRNRSLDFNLECGFIISKTRRQVPRLQLQVYVEGED